MRPRIICTYASKHTERKILNAQQQIKITIKMYTSLQSHPDNPICQHKMQVTLIKLSKFISSPKILKANQMLVTFHTLHIYIYIWCKKVKACVDRI